MKTSKIQFLLGATATAIGLLSMTGQAKAFSLNGATLSVGFECDNDVTALVAGKNPQGQWQYAHDSVGDDSGGLHYELYGMGVMQDANYVYFAINTYDMKLDAGRDTVDKQGKTTYNTGWGDLLINTTGKNVGDAQGSLFAVHFGANSGGESQVGLYSNVTTKSVADYHNGYASVSSLVNHFKDSPITVQQYISNQSQEVQDTYNLAYQQSKWSQDTYLKNQPQEVQDAYNLAYPQSKWSLDTYLKNQPQEVRDAYNKGTQSQRDAIKAEYNQFKLDATNNVNSFKAEYNQFKLDATNKVNSIKAEYNQLKQAAQNTVDQILAPRQEMVNKFQQTFFGDLSSQQGLAYFDKQGSNVINSGVWQGAIEMLTLQQLNQHGYNASQFQGNQTIAFRIGRSDFRQVPEPTALLGLGAVGLVLAGGKLRKQNVAK